MDKTIYGETEYLLEPFYGWNFDIINNDEIGKILHAKYRILKVLGKGNKSKVLLVEDIKTKDKLAVKIMLKKELEEILKNEYKILKELKEEGILRVFSYEEETLIEPPCFIMEYFEAKSLKELFYEGNLTQINILEIFLRLAYTINYLHDKLIVHWDIKPENIIVGENNKIKLIDFGIAFKTYEKDKGFGTVKYMSPQRILGEETDIKSDIYSYFMCMYEGVEGEYPYIGGDLKKRILNEKIKEFRNSNILIKRFLQRGLEKESYLRYENFSEIIEELKDIIFFERDIIPFLNKNNRGSLTSHGLFNNKNKEKCDFYFDLIYSEMGEKSQIQEEYARIKPFLLDYLRSINYNIEDGFNYVDFFSILDNVFDNLNYEILDQYTKQIIEEFLSKKEKRLRQITDKADLAFENKEFSFAINELKKASLQGSSYGYFRLGEIYEKGFGVAINNEIALENYRMSKKMNYVPAIKKMGDFYYRGEILEKNYDEAFKLFKLASEMGDISSQRFLGECYKLGLGVAVDYESAFFWYKSAYEKGDLLSSAGLGQMFEHGTGTEKNIEKAIFYYEKAINSGDFESVISLALIYDKGEGIEKNYEKAFKLFEKAAYAGNDRAQFYLGYYYEVGKNMEKDENKALFWFEKAAEKDNLEALNFLGKAYEEKEPLKALEYYQRALKYHDKKTNFNIGNFYIKTDFEKTKKYFTRAFEAGETEAYYQLGKAYVEGIYTEKNIKEAKKVLEKSSEFGHMESKILLGKLYLDSEYGVRNFTKAFILIEEASLNGIKEAMLLLGDLYENGYGVNKNIEEAEKWRKKADDNSEDIKEKSGIFQKIKKLLNR